MLVRCLDVGECLFERASGGNGLGERGAELGLAPRESFGYVSDLRRPLLIGALECCGGIAQSLLESVACCRSLHHRVVVLRLHVGQTRCRHRQLRGPLPVRVLPRSLGVGHSSLQGRAGEGFLSEPFFEFDLALARGNGRRRPFLLRRFERLARIIQLLLEDATRECGLRHRVVVPRLRVFVARLRVGETRRGRFQFRCMSLVVVLPRELGVGQLLLQGGAGEGLLSELLLDLHLTLGRDDQFGRDALLGVLVRRLYVSECPFNRAAGGNGISQRRAELGLAVGRGRGLRRAILLGRIERSRGDTQAQREQVARAGDVAQAGRELRLALGEAVREGRRFEPMPIFSATERCFELQELLIERRANLQAGRASTSRRPRSTRCSSTARMHRHGPCPRSSAPWTRGNRAAGRGAGRALAVFDPDSGALRFLPKSATSRPRTVSTTARWARTAPSGSARWTTGLRRSCAARSTGRWTRPRQPECWKMSAALSNGLAWSGRRPHPVPFRFPRALDRPPRFRPSYGQPSATGCGIASWTTLPAGRTAGPAMRRGFIGAAACPRADSTASAGWSAHGASRRSRAVAHHAVLLRGRFATLVITSWRPDNPDVLAKAPQSGSLFIASSPVAGAPVTRWADR